MVVFHNSVRFLGHFKNQLLGDILVQNSKAKLQKGVESQHRRQINCIIFIQQNVSYYDGIRKENFVLAQGKPSTPVQDVLF